MLIWNEPTNKPTQQTQPIQPNEPNPTNPAEQTQQTKPNQSSRTNQTQPIQPNEPNKPNPTNPANMPKKTAQAKGQAQTSNVLARMLQPCRGTQKVATVLCVHWRAVCGFWRNPQLRRSVLGW
jgi:hypothetical protein